MPHLVSSPVSPLPIATVLEQLRAAHGVLVARAKQTARNIADLAERDRWGTDAKRELVALTAEDRRPALLVGAAEKHSFAEVVNQCATIERMMDALRWAAGHDDFAGWTVAACHPTTSSKKAAGHLNHDLVLAGPDGALARFEVSDVAGPKDGNRKEEKDLDGLGFLRGQTVVDAGVALHRRFLVVSSETGERFRRRGPGVPGRDGLHYHRVNVASDTPKFDTWILEVRSAPPPA